MNDRSPSLFNSCETAHRLSSSILISFDIPVNLPLNTTRRELNQTPSDPNDIIDMDVFSQIRDMDDDEEEEGGGDHEFSKGIVWGFFDQAEQTFKDMESAMYVLFSM